MKKLFITSLLTLIFFVINPPCASAHQPRIVEKSPTVISTPEVSQAFYGHLQGLPEEFQIHASQPFNLYVGLLVPDTKDVQKNISAEIYKLDKTARKSIALLDGSRSGWKPYYEDFGQDNYFWGPEFKSPDSQFGKELKGKLMPAGEYRIIVYNPTNYGKYTLVTGYEEAFPPEEMLNALTTIPRLKVHFFAYPLTTLLLSPYISGYILVIYFLSFIVGFLSQSIMKQIKKKAISKKKRNIGAADRMIRFSLGVILLVYAVLTSWNPFIIFLSGYCLFESLFSWCIYYSAIGKNSCPIK